MTGAGDACPFFFCNQLLHGNLALTRATTLITDLKVTKNRPKEADK